MLTTSGTEERVARGYGKVGHGKVSWAIFLSVATVVLDISLNECVFVFVNM